MDKPAPTPFAELYPLAVYQSIADAAWWRSNEFDTRRRTDQAGGATFDRQAYNAALAADAADTKRVDEHKKVFTQAVERHLANLLEIGALTPMTGLKGREVGMASAWNAMVAREPADYARRWLFDAFERLFVDEFVRMDWDKYGRARQDDHVPGHHQPPTPDQVVKAWSGICSRMDEGTSEEYVNGLSIECNDQRTGDRCEIHFAKWQPTLMVRNAKHRLEPAKDVAKAELVSADFPVPTGTLLLTDYLRVEGFKEGVTFGRDREYQDLSLSSADGRDARIRAHAEEHGVAYTQTANTSVAVHRHVKTGRLMITRRWYDDAKGNEMREDERGVAIVRGWTSVGSFSCDMWRIMAFDRATAIARMEAGGRTDAAAELDTYLNSTDAYARNVERVDVEPGTWRIHTGDEFSKRVDRRRFGIPPRVHVWCVLERVATKGEAN